MTEDFLSLAKNLQERADIKPGRGNERENCDALVRQMRKDCLLAVCVSPKFGGPGLGVHDVAQICFEIARQSGSAGLIYAMHMSQAYSVVAHGAGPFFKTLQKRMVAEQLLIASGTSEKGPAGDILKSICTIETGEAGKLIINKSTPNISYIDHADLILVTANYLEDKPTARQRLVAAEVIRENFVPGHDIGFMGMRGILNRSYDFKVNFQTEAIFDGGFSPIARETMTPVIQILWAALWSGIAYTMIDKAKTFVSKEVPGEGDLSTLVHHELTRLINLHYQMNTMIRDAIGAYEKRDAGTDMGFALSATINRLKVECSELVVLIGTRAMNIIGIRAYASGGPYSLAAPMADAFSAPIMVSNYRLAMNTAKIERFVEERL